jgi:hypothetical protein
MVFAGSQAAAGYAYSAVLSDNAASTEKNCSCSAEPQSAWRSSSTCWLRGTGWSRLGRRADNSLTRLRSKVDFPKLPAIAPGNQRDLPPREARGQIPTADDEVA